MNTALLLGFAAVLAVGLAVLRWAGKQRRRALIGLVSMLLLAMTLACMALPVRDAAPSDAGADLLYVGVTEPGYLERIEGLREERAMVLIGPPAAEATIKLACPWARYEAPQTGRDLRQGVTLGVALDDLRHRLPQLRDGGRVFFLVPRTDNLARDRSQLEELVKAEPWLRKRLRTLYPGSGDARGWPALPVVAGEAPAVIDPDSPDYTIDVSVGGQSSMEALLTLRFAHAGVTKPISVQPGTNALVVGGSGTAVKLSTDMSVLRGVLPTPGKGRTNIFLIQGGTRYGETISQVQLTTRCEPPEIPVLIPEGRTEKASDLVKLLRANHLAVRPIPVSLPKTSADLEKLKEPKFQQTTQFADLVKGLGLLIVDLSLNEFEGQGLNYYLSHCDAPPTLLFVGTDGLDVAPPGWTVFVGTATNKLGTGRRVVLVKDMSGSMERAAGPGKLRIPDPVTKEDRDAKCIEVANEIAKSLYTGLGQRNVRGVLLPIGPADPRDGHGVLIPYGHTYEDYARKTTDEPLAEALEQYTSEANTERHKWEFGPHLKAVRKLMEKNNEPVSDIFAVIDATDVRGFPEAPTDAENGRFSDTQVADAAWLLQHGIRIHTVGIGGIVDPQVTNAIGGKPFLDTPTQPDLPTLLRAVQRHVYENVLPRLPVLPCEAGLETLKPEQAKTLREAAANKDLKLINVLFEYQTRQGVPNEKGVLLWGGHFAPGSEGLGAPIYLRCSYPAAGAKKEQRDCYWLAVDVRAELAASEHGNARQQNALTDLLIACVNSVTASALTPAPVVWQMDPSGHLRVMKRNRKPFNLTEFHATAGSTGAELDTRQLTRPGFRFPNLDCEVPQPVQVSVTDQDPRVGVQEVRLHLFGTPALPLNDKADRDLFGDDVAVRPQAEQTARPFAVPFHWMLALIVVGWLAWGVMIWRT